MIQQSVAGIMGSLDALSVVFVCLLIVVPFVVLFVQLFKKDKEINPKIESKLRYGGFWLRVIAACIDLFFVFLITSAVWLVFDLPIPSAADGHYFGNLYFFTNPYSILTGWLYFSIMESTAAHATIGKLLLGLRVVDFNGDGIHFGKATGRYFGKYFSFATLYIGVLMIAFTKRKQGLHDKLSNSLVVRKNPSQKFADSTVSIKESSKGARISSTQAAAMLPDFEAKEKLLLASLKSNLISEKEYNEKIDKLNKEKHSIQEEQENEEINHLAISNIQSKVAQLKELFANGLLTEDEVRIKTNALLTAETQNLKAVKRSTPVQEPKLNPSVTETKTNHPPTKSMLEADENIKKMEEVIKKLKNKGV